MRKIASYIDRLFLLSPFLLVTVILAGLFVFMQVKNGYDIMGDKALYTKEHKLIPGADFNVLYFGAKHLLAGDNIYNTNDRYSYYPDENEQINSGPTSFVYPPFMALVYTPLLLFPYNTAYFLYSAFTILVFILVIFAISKLVLKRGYFIFVSILCFLFSQTFLLHLERGQSDIIILAIIGLSFYFFIKEKSLLAGLFMGIATLLKFTPLIFIPYFFIKDKKSFYSSAATIFLGSAILGVENNLNFLKNLSSFAGGFSSGIWNNGFLGVIYNKYTFDLITISQAKLVFALVILPALLYFFYNFYRSHKEGIKTVPVILAEFAALLSCMIIIPSVSNVYNGVHLVFLFAAYWTLRHTLIGRRSYALVVLQDFLFFLIFSLPSLFYLRGYVTGFFSARSAYILCLAILIYYLTGKINKQEPGSLQAIAR